MITVLPTMEDPPTVEELKRENDDMRKRIEELEEDAVAKSRALQEERENRVSIVQEAREEERTKIRAEMEKLKQKMASDHLREVDAVREDTMLKAKQEMAVYQQMKDKEVEEKLRPLKEKVDANTTLEHKATKATKGLTAKHEAEMKKLHAALFELESARKDMKGRLADAVAADKKKSEEIRRLRDEHEKEMKKVSQGSRTDNKKQVKLCVSCVNLWCAHVVIYSTTIFILDSEALYVNYLHMLCVYTNYFF